MKGYKMSLKTLSVCGVSAALLLAASAASADTIMSFGTTSGADDDNQAGPIWGVDYAIDNTGVGVYSGQLSVTQNYVATYTVSNPDPSATMLQSLTWQSSGSTAFTNVSKGALNVTGDYYLAVLSGFTVTSAGAISTVGTVLGISSNHFTNPGLNAQLTWSFSGINLTAGQAYQFVLANTANPTLTTDFTTGQFELKTGTSLLTGSTLLGANTGTYGSRNNWEPVFAIDLAPVPEPSTMALAALGGAGMLLMLRRRKA